MREGGREGEREGGREGGRVEGSEGENGTELGARIITVCRQ